MVRKTPKITPRHRDPEVVQKAEEIFAGMGMSPEEAISIFSSRRRCGGSSLSRS